VREGIEGHQKPLAIVREGIEGHQKPLAIVREGIDGHRKPLAMLREGIEGHRQLPDRAEKALRGLNGDSRFNISDLYNVKKIKKV